MRWRSPKSSPGFDKRNKRRICGLLGEGGTVWEMAATSLHNGVFLDSENVMSERPIALVPTMIGLVESSEGAGGGTMAIQISYRMGCR